MIRLENVSLRFGGLSVLEGIDLDVPRGEFLALVGPNGAGKTTLLRVINGILDPDSGSVTVDGTPPADYSAAALSRKLATVPQNTHLGFSFTAGQVVEMGRTPHRSRLDWGDESDHVERALDRTDTTHLADRDVGELSGGERQRVLLARALAQEPAGLLLDEPTANLDINHQIRVLELVESLVGEGKTAVAAIHDIDLAARYCDRIALLADGEIRVCDTPPAVLGTDAVEAAFGVSTAISTDPATGTPRVTAVAEPPERNARVHVIGHGDGGATAIRTLRAAGYDVTLGPVPEGDIATEAADALGIETVTAPPFARLDGGVKSRVAQMSEDSHVVVSVDEDPVGRDGSETVLDGVDVRAQFDGNRTARARGDGGRAAVVQSPAGLVAAVRGHESTG
ncbi:MAG: ATP-binding cassette domain-containing protein [Halovenus sp.]